MDTDSEVNRERAMALSFWFDGAAGIPASGENKASIGV
jgi:hypothetical protein